MSALYVSGFHARLAFLSVDKKETSLPSCMYVRAAAAGTRFWSEDYFGWKSCVDESGLKYVSAGHHNSGLVADKLLMRPHLRCIWTRFHRSCLEHHFTRSPFHTHGVTLNPFISPYVLPTSLPNTAGMPSDMLCMRRSWLLQTDWSHMGSYCYLDR